MLSVSVFDVRDGESFQNWFLDKRLWEGCVEKGWREKGIKTGTFSLSENFVGGSSRGGELFDRQAH